MILANHGIISSSGGFLYDADALAFITAASITDNTQKTAVNTLVTDLKTYNIWTKMKALYPFVGGSATSHKYNLKDPRDLDAAFRLVLNGGWTHSATGVTPNGTTGYASLGSLNMNTIDPLNYSLGVYITTDASNNNYYDFGATNNIDTGWYLMNTRTGSNNVNYQAGSTNLTVSNANSQGFYQVSSNSATLTTVFKNSSILTTDTTTQAKTPFNQVFEIGRATIITGGGYYSDRNQAAFYISTYLDNTEKTALYNAMQAYQTTLGRQV